MTEGRGHGPVKLKRGARRRVALHAPGPRIASLPAMPSDSRSLTLFDFKTQKWSVLARANAGYPCWSRDGQYVYFLQMPPDPGVLRVGIRDRKVEQVASLKGFQTTGYFGDWLGIAPDDSPLLLKDTGTQEIVSLDWQAP